MKRMILNYYFNVSLKDTLAECVTALDWRPGGPGFESLCDNFASELWPFRLPRFGIAVTLLVRPKLLQVYLAYRRCTISSFASACGSQPDSAIAYSRIGLTRVS